jgi:predicted transcriptional regulator
MEKLLIDINRKVSQSKNRFAGLKNSTIEEKLIRAKAFQKEAKILDKSIPEIVNRFLKSNNLNDEQIDKLKEFIDDIMTDFMLRSGTSGINPDYRFDVKIDRT